MGRGGAGRGDRQAGALQLHKGEGSTVDVRGDSLVPALAFRQLPPRQQRCRDNQRPNPQPPTPNLISLAHTSAVAAAAITKRPPAGNAPPTVKDTQMDAHAPAHRHKQNALANMHGRTSSRMHRRTQLTS
jgi:hypothetical protein